MKKRLQKMLAPNSVMFYVLFFLFAVVGLYFSRVYGAAGIVVCIILRIVSLRTNAARQRQVQELMNNIEVDGGEIRPAVTRSPLPTAVALATTGEIVWANDAFAEISGRGTAVSGVRMGEIAPTFETGWLIKGQTAFPGELGIGKRQYHVFGSLVQSGAGQLMMLHFIDCTEFVRLRDAAETTRPAIAVIAIDNYEDLVKNTTDSEKSNILAGIDKRLFAWVKDSSAVLRKYDRDKYIFVIESAELDKLVARKFSVLQEVREIENHEGVVATLSIGIGRDGETLAESYQFAGLAIDMALSRGGDQAVVLNKDKYTFYGGNSDGAQKRKRVKVRIIAEALMAHVQNSDNVIIMGHKFADLDCVGSAIGIAKCVQSFGKQPYIIYNPRENLSKTMYASFMKLPGYENVFVDVLQAPRLITENSLLVITDTHNIEYVESEKLFSEFKRVVIIDHHRKTVQNAIEGAVINFHEPNASSCCEMVSELCESVPHLRLTRQEANALMSGIFLDTKTFTERTGARTFEAAAYLKKQGADTAEVKEFFKSDIESYKKQIDIIADAQVINEKYAVSVWKDAPFDGIKLIASKAADEMLNLNNIESSYVIYPEGGDTHISARSDQHGNVQRDMERLGGGGHRSAAGAQLKDVGVNAAYDMLIEVLNNPESEEK